MLRRIYLSGPMSSLPAHNFPAFNAEAKRLRGLGYDVVNPVDISPDAQLSWGECLKKDIVALMDCDTIALLPGWDRSRGAKLELHIAIGLGYSVFVSAAITAEHSCDSMEGGA